MMTREEAIEALQKFVNGYEKNICGEAVRQNGFVQAIKVVISALRPVTREQVERVWRGGWKCQSDCGVTECTACKWNIEEYCGDYNFCPHCGAPMNDEAIQMVMERMKELK